MKVAFYKSPAFRLALVYLACCAFAVIWSEARLNHAALEAWSSGRPAPFLTQEQAEAASRGEPWATDLSVAAGELQRQLYGVASCVRFLTLGNNAAVLATPFLVALGALARTVARARLRAGKNDPLARVRAFAKKHAALTVAAPGLVSLANALRYCVQDLWPWDDSIRLVAFAVAAPIVFVLHVLLTRLALRALLAPTLDENGEAKNAAVAEDFEFAAVALTREARRAVAGLGVVTVAMVAGLLALPTFDNVAIDVGVALYVPFALFCALYFRRASRISVGLDGIHVRGTSRSRFYAFSELDAARANGVSIDLHRGDEVVLRLQLHGPDAVRRDALTTRLAAAVARAAEERDEPVTRFVNGATRVDLARAAEGGGSYRHAAVSREQIWAALEGPAVASEARVAAAEALVTDVTERARFRVAAERCAEPTARARMQELLDEQEEQELALPLPARRATVT